MSEAYEPPRYCVSCKHIRLNRGGGAVCFVKARRMSGHYLAPAVTVSLTDTCDSFVRYVERSKRAKAAKI